MIARGFPADNLSKIGSTDFAVLRNTARIPMSDNTGGLAIILKKKKERERNCPLVGCMVMNSDRYNILMIPGEIVLHTFRAIWLFFFLLSFSFRRTSG